MIGSTTRGILSILAAAAIYATTGFFVRILTALGLDVYSINFTELVIGLPLIVSAAHLSGESIHQPSPVDLPWLALIGLCHFGVTMTLFYAYNSTTIANVEFLHYTFPILTMVGAVWLFGERLDVWKLSSLLLAVCGLLLLFNPSLSVSREMRIGNLLALCSALPIAAMTLAGRRMKNRSAWFTTFWSTLAAAAIYLPFFLIHNTLAITALFSGAPVPEGTLLLGFEQLVGIALAALFFMALAAPFYYYGLRHVEASRAGILLLMEIVIATAAAALFYGEIPELTTALGGSLILASAILVMRSGPSEGSGAARLPDTA